MQGCRRRKALLWILGLLPFSFTAEPGRVLGGLGRMEWTVQILSSNDDTAGRIPQAALVLAVPYHLYLYGLPVSLVVDP